MEKICTSRKINISHTNIYMSYNTFCQHHITEVTKPAFNAQKYVTSQMTKNTTQIKLVIIKMITVQ